jgi:phage replication O-like protein O
MANPQKENGHTQIANDIIEHLIASGLNGTELAVVLLILRKTYGWNKKEDQISISQFMDYIPASRQTICTALSKLQLVKIIRLVHKGTSTNSSNLWSFNKDYDKWQLVRKYRLVKVSDTTSQENLTKLVKKPRHTKDIKDNIQKTVGELSFRVKYVSDTLGENFVITPRVVEIIDKDFAEYYIDNSIKKMAIHYEEIVKKTPTTKGLLNWLIKAKGYNELERRDK